MKTNLNFYSEIWIPQPRAEIFPFFENAVNLEILTPGWLNFQILTPRPIQMTQGALIDYQIKLHRIPFKWKTEISVWEPPLRFVDLQLKGPYRTWIHEHRFLEKEGGTLVIDDVAYRPWGGKLIDRLFVRPEIERIFKYRAEKLQELFGG